MFVITAVYANRPGTRFDRAYYLGPHTELATRLLQPLGLHAIRVTLGESDMAGNAPPFWAISEMHFESQAAFAAAMQRCGATLFEDAQHYTDVEPAMQVSTLVD